MCRKLSAGHGAGDRCDATYRLRTAQETDVTQPIGCAGPRRRYGGAIDSQLDLQGVARRLPSRGIVSPEAGRWICWLGGSRRY